MKLKLSTVLGPATIEPAPSDKPGHVAITVGALGRSTTVNIPAEDFDAFAEAVRKGRSQ